ncbi:TetR/AcrR family transcriptional regulator, partial [Pseudonocardia lacus]|uniref:TetR/AcrR family transcriptional regulator n=1 Tax=Pseudonocardia lacus TaxID=2835865 RepID=UPI001BDD1238
MSEIPPARRRRADARRHAAAVLDAATRVLGRTPEAGIEQVAAAAGVTRQTVYAHYPTRGALLAAVLDRISTDVLDELDAVERDAPSATAALLALLDATWRLLERYPLLLHESVAATDPAQDHTRHEPIRARFERVLRRGRDGGEFDHDLPLDWLVAAVIALGHAAGAEVGAGRTTAAAAS